MRSAAVRLLRVAAVCAVWCVQLKHNERLRKQAALHAEIQQTLEEDVQEVLTAKSMTRAHLSKAEKQFQRDLHAAKDDASQYQAKAAELGKKATKLLALHKTTTERAPKHLGGHSSEKALKYVLR